MFSIRDVDHVKVLGEPNKKTGVRRKAGTVGYVLFHPTDPRVVGFAVERSDLALMVERKDRFVALDRVALVDGELQVHGKAAWDSAAAKRLGIGWDKTVGWAGMDVRTESGQALGTVRDGAFDETTGELDALVLTEGTSRDVAIGVRELPAGMVRGFDGEAVIVANAAADVEVDGGAAAAAAKAAAVVKVKSDQVADAATEKFDEVAVAAGEAAGKAAFAAKKAAKAAANTEPGKKAMSWLKSVKDGVVDAMGSDDD